MALRITTLFIFSLSLLTFYSSSLSAQEASDVTITPQELEKIDEESEENMRDIYEQMGAITDDLGPTQLMHFQFIYSGHNIIQTVGVVKDDVNNAVNECGKNNPDMKNMLDERYTEWVKAVDPIISDAQNHLDKMVKAQEYADEKELYSVLEGLDEIREETENRIKKIPVTSPEACNYLHKKMDETQEQMVNLLKAALLTMPEDFEAFIREQEALMDAQDAAEEAAEDAGIAPDSDVDDATGDDGL